MKKCILSFVLMAGLLVPSVGQAQTTDLSALRAQIADMIAQVNDLQQQLAAQQSRQSALSVISGSQSSSSNATSSSGVECRIFSYNLSVGSTDIETNSEVSYVQRVLRATGDFTHPEITGYFGIVTQTAVQSFQARKGIASSGTPATTGYGAVGPQTRSALSTESCSIANGADAGGNDAGSGADDPVQSPQLSITYSEFWDSMLSAFSARFLSNSAGVLGGGGLPYDVGFDYDNDGDIDNADLFKFRSQYQSSEGDLYDSLFVPKFYDMLNSRIGLNTGDAEFITGFDLDSDGDIDNDDETLLQGGFLAGE